MGRIRALVGRIGLMLFVATGMALMGGLYLFGRLAAWVRRSAKSPVAGPELHYFLARTRYAASALERPASIESAE